MDDQLRKWSAILFGAPAPRLLILVKKTYNAGEEQKCKATGAEYDGRRWLYQTIAGRTLVQAALSIRKQQSNRNVCFTVCYMFLYSSN